MESALCRSPHASLGISHLPLGICTVVPPSTPLTGSIGPSPSRTPSASGLPCPQAPGLTTRENYEQVQAHLCFGSLSISSSVHLLTCPSDYRFLGLSFFMSTYLLDTLAGEGEIEQKGTQTEEN